MNSKIGLDVDGICAHFTKGFYEWFNQPFVAPTKWEDEFISNNFKKIVNVDEFWSNLPILSLPETIDYEVTCYITARPCGSHISWKWLVEHGFPDRPVFTVGPGQSKVKVINDLGLNFFVDDHADNMIDINKNTNCTCFLFTQPHNEWIHLEPRLNCLSELKQYIND